MKCRDTVQAVSICLLLVAVGAPVALAGDAGGFHRGGSASCLTCHGAGAGDTADGSLETASDVCLRCHAAGGADPPAPTVLGTGSASARMGHQGAGDFAFLLEDDLDDAPETGDRRIGGHAAGHNVVAPRHGLGADPVLAVSPGGTFPSSELSCTSCHDPHGNDNFRFLRGAGELTSEGPAAVRFAYPAPDAVAVPAGTVEGPANHTAYRSGMSAWCGNCHEGFLRASHVHPVDEPLGAGTAAAYNAYRGTADCVRNPPRAARSCGSGTRADAYLPQVPFEDPGMEVTSTAGPSSTSRLSCVTCHRAHASSAPDAGRWDFGVTHLTDDGRTSGSRPLPNPYGTGQRSLCNQCHGADAFDAVGG